MMSAETWDGIWIGALVSIPVSIGVGLVVPAIQGKFTIWGKASRRKKRDRTRAEYHRVLYYALHSDFLLGELILRSAVVTLFGFGLVILGLFLGTFDTLSQTRLAAFRVTWWSIASFWAGILTSLWPIVRIYLPFERVVARFIHVKNFAEYAETVPDELRDKRIEKMILRAGSDPIASLGYHEFMGRMQDGDEGLLAEINQTS